MSIESEIEWIGSPHFERGRRGVRPAAIVMHVSDGPEGVAGRRAVDAWFGSAVAGVSAHFCIGEGISQYVRAEDTAWANGVVEPGWNRAIPWLAECVRRGHNPNWYTLSIEWVGRPLRGTPAYLVEVDYRRGLALVRHLCARYQIPPDAQHIGCHAWIAPASRPHCPGPGFPMARLLGDLAAPAADDPTGAPATLASTGASVTPIDADHCLVTWPGGAAFTLAYGFKTWWLRDPLAWGNPISELVYDGDGNGYQSFEHGQMIWQKATNTLERAAIP